MYAGAGGGVYCVTGGGVYSGVGGGVYSVVAGGVYAGAGGGVYSVVVSTTVVPTWGTNGTTAGESEVVVGADVVVRGDVVVGFAVVVVGAAELLVVDTTEVVSVFGSSSPTAAPSATSPTRPAPSTHGHLRRFCPPPAGGLPPWPTAPNTCVGSPLPLGLVWFVHC
ncbi:MULTISPECIES: hypothetical protein [Rhodococcus]|uniref:Uncharacterized protein n=1 Tax=Rhodococcus rhodochrous TaxID=1829 RepID=A0AAW4XCC6_RHORH|nr:MULTISPECIES: hypothetical protein [Rhodococcus]MCD2110677.1 hypothetical protein [Rhodococcus rhodochrous]WAL49072.1 hypothetical protein OQN32_17100 [Rhodococcus pyridinivorans]